MILYVLVNQNLIRVKKRIMGSQARSEKINEGFEGKNIRADATVSYS